MSQKSLPVGASGPQPDVSETLEASLLRVVFESPDTAWCVVKVQPATGGPEVTAVGNLYGLKPGQPLRLGGRWVTDPRYGRQFEVESFLPLEPSSETGIERYLGSGVVRGLGPVMARRLVERFGLDTLEVIDKEPERLTEVEGIGPVRSRRIQQAWQQQRQVHQVMLFLQSHEVSATHAAKIHRRYGDDALRLVRENPYRLADEIAGIGFATADRIADRLGVARDSPERAEAGLRYLLNQAADEGHLYLPRTLLVDRSGELLELPAASSEEALQRLQQEGSVMVEPDASGEEAVYLRSLYLAERGIAARILRLETTEAPEPLDADAACRSFEERHHLRLAELQRRAVAQALSERVLVITGGPGTGKTTLVRAIVESLVRDGLRVELAAPTGRAAMRLAAATGRPARTLHRLLEFNPVLQRFERNGEHPLEAEAVIVDEASMIDTLLAHHLLRAVPTRARMILVGDADQLPPVGPGYPMAEIIASGRVPVVRLEKIFRQAADSFIVANAHRIRAGRRPAFPPGGEGDCFFIERDDPEALIGTLRELVVRRIPKSFGLDPVEDLQVLTPMRRGPLGTHALNVELQALLNSRGEPVPGHRFRIGDKVMQTRNNYRLEVFNGDLGRVEAADAEEGTLRVRFDDRQVVYETGDADQLELAYACSVHKSQGSEYPAVVLVLHTQHYVLLQRNLLYTGLTRGKQLVVIVGSRRAIDRAVRNHAPQRRFTRLAARLRR